MLSYRKRPLSFFGVVVFLIIVALLIFGFFKMSEQITLNKIEKINAEFEITTNNLIPYDRTGYVIELNKINSKETDLITEYVLLYDDAEKLDRMYTQIYSLETPCITEKTLEKFEYYMELREAYQDLFIFYNKKKLEKIYWDRYITGLDNRSLESTLERLQNLSKC